MAVASCSGIEPSVLVNPAEDRLLCASCRRVIKRPFQTPCGHHYCFVYVQNISGDTRCTAEGCEEIFSKEVCYEDKATNKEIQRQPCRCPLSTECSWRGPLAQLDAHSGECDYRLYKCPHCDERLAVRVRPDHELECDKTLCTDMDVGCRDKLGSGAQVTDMYAAPCRSTDRQCEALAVSRGAGGRALHASKEESMDHDRQVATVHLDLLMLACDSLHKVATISPSDCVSDKRDIGDPTEAAAAAWRALASACRQLLKRLGEVLAGLVHNDLPAIHEQKLRLIRRIEELSRLSHRADKDEKGLQERLQNLQLSTFNGTCLFKIDRFHEQRRLAITGSQTRIYSPYFFTSPRGYKLRMVCYLNGDGSGKDTHISLFIIICKHRYDAILSWPFKYRVNLICVNQDNASHLKQSFTPDEGSSSFKRPDTDANVATGCPKFVELKKLAAPSPYLKDDTIFFKCVIDVPSDVD